MHCYTIQLLNVEKFFHDMETCIHASSGFATGANATHIRALHKLCPSLFSPAFSVNGLRVHQLHSMIVGSESHVYCLLSCHGL